MKKNKNQDLIETLEEMFEEDELNGMEDFSRYPRYGSNDEIENDFDFGFHVTRRLV